MIVAPHEGRKPSNKLHHSGPLVATERHQLNRESNNTEDCAKNLDVVEQMGIGR